MLSYIVVALLFGAAFCQEGDSWQKYIIGPQSLDVYPKAVLSSNGSVVNPTGVLPGQAGDAVLTRAAGQAAPEIIIDFGLNVVGFLNIAFNGASNNTPGIRLAFSETKQFLTDLSDYSRSNMANPITPGSDQIAVKATPYTWTDTWGCANGTQVCSDGLHGFRYVKIYLDALDSDAPIVSKTGSVNISSVSLKYSAFLPTTDSFEGWFECSDEQLSQFWYAGVYTNDLTTDTFRSTDCDPRDAANPGLEGRLVLHDGGKRDRDPYVGDVAVSGKTTYLSHGNLSSAAPANVLTDLGDHQRDDGWIPPASVLNYSLNLFDYPLWWVISILDHVMYTGDTDLLAKYFPNIVRVLDEYYPAHTNASSNLLSKPAGMGDYAFVGRDGESSYYNALYVLALQAGAAEAVLLRDDAANARWTDRAAVVSESFNATFWDESVGAYKNYAGQSTAHPQDTNSLAILAGIPGPNRSLSALSYFTNKTARPYGNAFMDDDSLVNGGSQRVYAFMSNFEIKARFEMEDSASALDEIRRLYGWMYSHDPEITYWEGVGAEGSMYQGGFTSSAHGWSTGIVSILTNYIVGLTPTRPGGIYWEFDPADTPLKWARAQVPTIYGPFEGGWENNDNGTYRVNINAPIETKLRVKLPVYGADYIISHNGEVVWNAGRSLRGSVSGTEKGHVLLADIAGGKHVIEAVRNQ